MQLCITFIKTVRNCATEELFFLLRNYAQMERTIVQLYSSELIRHLKHITKTIDGLEHRIKKGQLRELFVENLVSARAHPMGQKHCF